MDMPPVMEDSASRFRQHMDVTRMARNESDVLYVLRETMCGACCINPSAFARRVGQKVAFRCLVCLVMDLEGEFPKLIQVA